jgi:uncharacterized protein YhbP (UPF0306 family)
MSKSFSKLHQFLQTESVLTLATSDAQGAWSTPLIYVADTSSKDLFLYFLSSVSSRHIKPLAEDGRVAVSIHSNCQGNWQSICGVQMQAFIKKVDTKKKHEVEVIYLNRFPEVKALIESPQSEQERKIGLAYNKSMFYCLAPTYIRFINNSDHFSSRTEWNL